MSIPYSRKYKLLKYKLDLAAKTVITSFLVTLLLGFSSDLFKQPLISPVSAAPSVSLESSPQTGQETEGGKPTVKQVQAYLKQIFGSKWKIAWAVAQNECNSKRKEWPVCVNSWGTQNTGEHSVGMFQINLARGEGKGAKVHWDKIPAGNTLGEKEVWLGNWKNNILTAYVVSQGGTNWNPWTAYTSGAYLKDL
jgi:hypothetical protein